MAWFRFHVVDPVNKNWVRSGEVCVQTPPNTVHKCVIDARVQAHAVLLGVSDREQQGRDPDDLWVPELPAREAGFASLCWLL